MALGLSSGGSGGEIRPYVKYDAKAGRMFRIDRVQGSDGQYQTDQVEITNTVQFVADLANIRVGWINYTAQGPIRKLVVLGKEAIPARPTDTNSEGKLAFKQGFELDILLNKDSGGGPSRILGSAAGCVIDAMDELHDAFYGTDEAKAGKLPVVKIASVSPVKSGQSTNYKPIFQIVSWVDRPAALPVGDDARVGTLPPSTGSSVVPPPSAAPQPAASASDFG
jgi:hypothetical protein